jgi:hypothetical protein
MMGLKIFGCGHYGIAGGLSLLSSSFYWWASFIEMRPTRPQSLTIETAIIFSAEILTKFLGNISQISSKTRSQQQQEQ